MQTSHSHIFPSSSSSTNALQQTMVTISSSKEIMLDLIIHMIGDKLGFNYLQIKSSRKILSKNFHKYVKWRLQKKLACLMQSDSYHLRNGYGMEKASTTLDQAIGLPSQIRNLSHMKSTRGAYRLLQMKMHNTKRHHKCLNMA